MGRIASTGVISVWFVPTIASATLAPTVSEVTAGTDLTPLLTRDGLTTPLDGSTIDIAGANSRYNATASGSYGGQPITLKCFRDSVTGSDTAYVTLPRQTQGFFVIRQFGGATKKSADPILAAQKVDTWPIDVLSRTNEPIADNEARKVSFQLAITAEPVEQIAVLA